jgi:hypothetical protein
MEELLNAIECVLNDDDRHIVKEPIGLSCGHSICKECIPKNRLQIVCSKCKTTNTNDLITSRASLGIQYLLNANIQKLIQHVKSEFDTHSIQVAGRTLA